MEIVGRPEKCPWVGQLWGLCNPGLEEGSSEGSAGREGKGMEGKADPGGLKRRWGRIEASLQL